jgi:hypothetical protein
MANTMTATTEVFDGEKGDLAEFEDDALQAVAIALRLKGYKPKEIAVAMDVPVSRVRRVLTNGRTSGALRDVVNDLQATALPLAVEKLIEKLEDGHEWAIKETLRGLGAFRTHTAQQIDTKSQSTELVVSFVQPAQPITANPAGIVGRSREEIFDAPIQTLRLQEASAVGTHEDGPEGAGEPGRGGEGPRHELLPLADAVIGERVSLQSPQASGEVVGGQPVHESA